MTFFADRLIPMAPAFWSPVVVLVFSLALTMELWRVVQKSSHRFWHEVGNRPTSGDPGSDVGRGEVKGGDFEEEDALRGPPAWNGRVLIDATNPFIQYSPRLVLADLGDKGASEVVAALAPGARVVKAFNSIVTARFNEGPVKNGGRRIIFVSGDHPEPKQTIKSLIESFGFVAIDLGGLATGGRLQQAGGPLAGRDLVAFGSL